ncbi:MAG: hypothetical protein QOJ16_3229, partial [Acidobacteriota bacterium]|nr:hypothetical protein [Acidobacteriota bacterium]
GEVEEALRRHPAVREAVVVARASGGVRGGSHLVGYVVPVEEGVAGGLAPEVLRAFLRERLPEFMVPGLFVELAALPLLPNGKVERRALPEPEAGAVAPGAGYVAPRTEVERRLTEIWAEVLGVERVGIHDDFFQLGGDSILSLQIVARAHRASIELTPRQLFEQPTIAQLAAVAGVGAGIVAEQGVVAGRVPLLPIQRWFFAQDFRAPHWFNQPLLLAVGERIAPSLAGRVLGAVLSHHDALRLRFAREDGGWVQRIEPPLGPEPVASVDLSGLPEPRQASAIEEVGTEVQSSLDLGRSPLVRLVGLDLGAARPGRLLLVLHHLVMDELSLGFILEDLETAFLQARRGEPLRLPAKTSSYKAWAERLVEHARSAAVLEEVPYWTSPLRGQVRPLPVAWPAGDNRESSARVAWSELGEAQTAALLREVPKVYRMGVQEVLLAALGWTLSRWTGDGLVQVDLETPGREAPFPDLDVSRTVGWFTAIYPQLLDLRGLGEAGGVLRAVKEQVRAVPGGGLGYGLLRYLLQEETVCALPPSEVLFNYGGVEDGAGGRGGGSSIFTPAGESPGPDLAPWEKRTHLLEIDGAVRGGRVRFGWSYSANSYPAETIESLAQSFVAVLGELIEHCLSPEAGGYTPADFPLSGLTQEELDRVVGRDREVEDVYPLSPVQQGMLFHTVFEPGSGMYVGQFSDELTGPVDIPALKGAWQRVAERHTALRTGMVWQEVDRPLQIVRRQVEPPWTIEDWSDLSEAEGAERLAQYLARDRERGFEVSVPPLLRLALFRLGPERHLLLWSFHQMAFDGWSLPILLHEVKALYQGLATGREVSLAATRPFRDYIAWLGRLDTSASELFWRRLLGGFSAPTLLPEDARAGTESGHAEVRYQMSAADHARLAAVARENRITLNTLAQGAWGILLSRWSGEDDVVFGTTVSGRPADLPGVEDMVGLFLNTLPVRLGLSLREPLQAWLKALQEQQVEVRQYEHTPLFEIQRWSEVGGGRPLFESVLVFENYPEVDEGGAGGAGLSTGDMKVAEQANFPLVLSIEGADLLLLLNYDEGRLARVSAERLLAHFVNILRALPGLIAEGRLGDVPVLSAAEEHHLLREWNDTVEAGLDRRPVQLLFEEQVRRTPTALALECETDRWTYEELNERANRVAHYLGGLGVAPGALVAVGLERSALLVAAVLGVLKAGAVYVPLDPSHPPERLSLLLADSGAAVLLGDGWSAAVPPPHDARVVVLDAERLLSAALAVENPRLAVDGEDLAYLIYTSGTTGRPKAVMVEHRGLSHTLASARHRFAIFAADRMLHLAPFSFDISLFELWLPLLAGGTVHLLTREEILDPQVLVRALERASLVHTVPSLMRQLLAHLEAVGRPVVAESGPRGLFIGGDAVPAELLAEMQRVFPRAFVEVLYGPTEATIICSSQAVSGEVEARNLLGRPLANVSLRLLDRHGRPVAVGIAGEIHVGGPGVARGYLGREELTRERFVLLDGERFYRTGDLARYRPQGVLEFLGRIDHQVKVRGFRVELGEVEARLAAHPSLRESVVVAREEGPEKRLVAYFVPVEAAAVTTSELRRFLLESLPEYMVPGTFVALDALPLTPTGKLDRQALPAPDASRPDLEVGFAAPEDAFEQRLAAIWSEVLGRERIGRHDNFFELGGDSILSLQISSRAHRAGLQLSPKQIFEHPTIAELAVAVREGASIAAEQGPVVGPVPLVPIQRRFLAADPVEPHHFNLPLLLETRARIEPASAARALAAVLAHHDALRARFLRTDAGWEQVFGEPGGETPITSLDLSALPAERRSGTVEAAAGQAAVSLDLAVGPLVRVVLCDFGAGVPGRLLLVFHHLVTDEISQQILLEDLEEALGQARRGQPVTLPLKMTSFKAWAERLAAYSASPALLDEALFWLAPERGEVLPLPVDRVGGVNLDRTAEYVDIALPAAETEALLHEVPKVHRTEAREAILTAVALALARWSGRRLVLVDLEGHGREDLFPDVNVSRTVGWFTAVYPVQFDLRASLETGAALREVRDRLRAVPAGGLGYGILRYLGGDNETAERLRRQPRAEVIFNYRGRDDRGGGGEAGGVAVPAAFGVALESPGRDLSPRALRTHLLEIDGGVEDGRLRFSWSYHPSFHRRATIERLVQDFGASLSTVIAHCLSPETREPHRPSDFPLARLDEENLSQLGSMLDEIDGISG